MKLQIKSDLHLEFSIGHCYERDLLSEENEFYINPEADVLILAGDITTFNHVEKFKEYLEDVKIPILYVPGNHEYYTKSIDQIDEYLKTSLNNSNITLLQKSTYIKEDTTFIGATLWTDIDSEYTRYKHKSFSDFQIIKDLTLDRWLQLHNEHITYIKDKLQNCETEKKVVITHHLPSKLSTPIEFANSSLNPFFSSNLDYLMLEESAPNIWVHGHTHNSFDYILGKTRVVCNPYGYFPYDTNYPLYNNNLLIEI